MSLRTKLLKTADKFRRLSGPAFADIRTHQLTVRTRTWTGTIVGEGTYTDSDFVVAPYYPVRAISQQETFTGGGRYNVGDITINHITPFDGISTGYTKAQLYPAAPSNNVDIIHVLTGPNGEVLFYRCIEYQEFRPFTIRLVLRQRADTPG